MTVGEYVAELLKLDQNAMVRRKACRHDSGVSDNPRLPQQIESFRSRYGYVLPTGQLGYRPDPGDETFPVVWI